MVLRFCMYNARCCGIKMHSPLFPLRNYPKRSFHCEDVSLRDFRRMRHIPSHKEFLDMKFWRWTVDERKDIKNPLKRARNRSSRQLNTLLGEIVRLMKATTFPSLERLHPFEKSVVELTMTPGEYERVIGGWDTLRKRLNTVGKKWASAGANASSMEGAADATESGVAGLKAMLAAGERDVTDFVNMAARLKRLPCLDLQKPTVALFGFPNVGKSSIVGALSSSKPEVANYPFTTRAVSVGHMRVNLGSGGPDGKDSHETWTADVEGQGFGSVKVQIVDTPGLLLRDDGRRKTMELLSVAVLEHTESRCLFVLDLSETCGYPMEDQLKLREELRTRFPHRTWMDVGCKSDLPMKPRVVELLRGVSPLLLVSTASSRGLDELRRCVVKLMNEEEVAAMASSSIAATTTGLITEEEI